MLNPENSGFARACNQGLAVARGSILALLNNDALPAPGSAVPRFRAALADRAVGLAGPVTNRIGNEAEVEVGYDTWGDYLVAARARAAEHAGQVADIGTVTMFCLAMRRDAYERIGPLDQRFEIGLLEDDDYSLRAREAGLRTVCLQDVLVHHFGETSFGELVPTGEYGRILAANKRRFEEKWGRPWEPYTRPSKPDYVHLTHRIQQVVSEKLPPEAVVLVVSRGDDELLRLEQRRAHFPPSEEGGWAGHHPATSEDAVTQLEAMREAGGEFLILPSTGLWWLEHYRSFGDHLERNYTAVVRDEETCVIWSLNGSNTSGSARLSVRCSIVIPVHGRAGLTRQCIDTVLGESPATAFELIVVDDASPDDTAEVLRSYGDALTVISRERNAGFATACNDGAAAPRANTWSSSTTTRSRAKGGSTRWWPLRTRIRRWPWWGASCCSRTTPSSMPAWSCARTATRAICTRASPAEHPAVNKARRFQAVTAASMLVRGTAFEQAGGFDVEFRNCLEDTDLCMRLGELGYEVHYCPESVLQHLESVSRGRRSSEISANTRLFKERWGERAERDDLRYYLEDGLLRLRYRDAYPIRIELAPELAVAADLASGRFIELQSQQVADLLRETVRLTAHVADLDVRPPQADAERSPGAPDRDESRAWWPRRSACSSTSMPSRSASPRRSRDARVNGRPGFAPGEGLAYLDLKERIRPVLEATVPPGAIMLVVSRGDDSLVELPEREGWHFPREADGAYAGRHPVDSDEAITGLERLRGGGRSVPGDPRRRRLVAGPLRRLRAPPRGALRRPHPRGRAVPGVPAVSSAQDALTAAELREEVVRLGPWHMDVEITPEVSTRAFLDAPPGSYPKSFGKINFHSPREGFQRRLGRLFPQGLEGRSVLDCACNCGAYLFYAKEAGAGHCVGFDLREHWIDQARSSQSIARPSTTCGSRWQTSMTCRSWASEGST